MNKGKKKKMKFVNAAKAIAFSSIIEIVFSASALKYYEDTKKNRVDDFMFHQALQAPSYQDSANQRAVHAHLQHSLVLSKKKLALSHASRSLSIPALPSYSWSQLGNPIQGNGNATVNATVNAYDWFGYSISTSEDGLTVAVGAVYDESHPNGNYGGYVQVFAYDTASDSWNQLGQTIPSNSLAHDYSGWSISLSANGKVLAVSSPDNSEQGENAGRVRIFRFKANRNKWIQRGDSIYGENAEDHSGVSVSLSANGKVVAVGAPDNTGINGTYSGHARVHAFLNGNWTQVGQDIDGEDIADWSGVSVSLSSDGLTLAVGAKGNDANGINAGHVRVYTLDQNETAWNKLGQDLNGEAESDYFGYSVSLSADGRTVATGAPYNDGTGTSAGHVRVYQFSSAGVNTGRWIQVGNDIDGEEAYDESGWSVSLASDGLTVAIGSPKNTYGNSAGYTRVFRLDESTNIWKQMGANICGLEEYDYSGWSVSLSGDGKTVAVGDTEHDANGVVDSGQVRVFKLKVSCMFLTVMSFPVYVY